MELVSRRSFLGAVAASAGAVGFTVLASCASGAQSRQNSSFPLQFASSAADCEIDPSAFLMSFIVMSDTHISADKERNIEHFRNALADIQSFDKKPNTIVIVGDITDGGLPEQYDLVRSLCAQEGFDFDDDFVKVMGNHDQYSDNFDPAKTGWDEQYIRFMNEAGVSSVYYDREVAGQHFICLGPDIDAGNSVRFNFSAEQMSWLGRMLDEDESAGKMSYIFCHEPLTNTLRNTGQGSWAASNSIVDEDAIRSLLADRSRAVLFTGHTHLYPDVAHPDDGGPLYVNDGAVGPGQISPDRMDFPEAFMGSFGWLVSVFNDRIELQARDFLQHEWIGGLDYMYSI